MYSRLFAVVLAFVAMACTEVAPPEPVLPLPSQRQLAWHEMEFYAFVHFNMNTFSDMEWGLGDEKPEQFNPSQLDCRQWARVCKEAGMKGIILTAKHHDGFCLWPSEFTEHSVKNSPWKEGKGDVVRDLADACKEYGLKMGIYLSPWDRNHADYGKPEYITYFRNQLRELLTNYGEVFEVWFDGANGGTGYYGGANENRKIDRETYYDWENTRKIVRELQPNACMFSDAGPDVRWVGNEEGWARKTNWCMLKRDEVAPGVVEDIEVLRAGQEDGTHWVPAEVDVSIRPGWYYHKYEDHKVKSLPRLLDIYYHSVGRNASFLLNFPVDQRGLIHEKDVEQVMKLANTVKADFAHNLAAGKNAEASNTRGGARKYNARNITDDDPDTYWATDDGVIQSSVTIDLEGMETFNRFLVQEDIRLGQRVKAFTVEVHVDGEWKEIASETTVGRKRILRLDNATTDKVRLNITDARACPVITNIGIYCAPKVLVEPEIRRDKNGAVTMRAFDTGLDIYYTTDGSEPTEKSERYKGTFNLDDKATVKALVTDSHTGLKSAVAEVRFDISAEKWILKGNFDENENEEAILDGDPLTTWNAKSIDQADVVIDIGEEQSITGFTYLPDQGRWNAGIISQYEFYVSGNGKSWGAPVSKGEFANIKNSPTWQKKEFKAQTGRFIRFKAVAPATEGGRAGIAELGIITE